VTDEEKLLERLNAHYGASYAPQGRLTLRKEKLFLYTGEETKIPHDWAGIHLATADLSLSIEGAQELGTTASRNLVTVTGGQADAYYLGEDLDGFEGEGHAILRTRDRIIGPGLLEGGKIKNTLPESRKAKHRTGFL
jgi:NOL1/NOP2/fmu family ribosome biogenesis protein